MWITLHVFTGPPCIDERVYSQRKTRVRNRKGLRPSVLVPILTTHSLVVNTIQTYNQKIKLKLKPEKVFIGYRYTGCSVVWWLERWTCDREIAGSTPVRSIAG